MSDQQIIQALIARNPEVTRQFFFRDCRPLFVSVIRKVFTYEVDYDEFVNEFYLYLMENEGHRLKLFEGRSTIYQWLKVIAIRYFVAKKSKMIENRSDESLLGEAERRMTTDERRTAARMDIYRLFRYMTNKRQVYVLKRLILDDAEPEKVAKELHVTVDNLYNIKKRAIAALAKIAVDEEIRYEQ